MGVLVFGWGVVESAPGDGDQAGVVVSGLRDPERWATATDCFHAG